MSRAIFSVIALVFTFGLLGHVLRAETDRQEHSLRQQAAEICPKVWADPELVKAKGLTKMVQQVCPEA